MIISSRSSLSSGPWSSDCWMYTGKVSSRRSMLLVIACGFVILPRIFAERRNRRDRRSWVGNRLQGRYQAWPPHGDRGMLNHQHLLADRLKAQIARRCQQLALVFAKQNVDRQGIRYLAKSKAQHIGDDI